MIEDLIKGDIKHFLINPDNLKKYIISKSEKSLNSDFEVIEYIHCNLSSLAAENIGKIGHRRAS